MSRLANKIAMLVGAGQSPGETLGNGRATAVLFASEGASVPAVDRDIASARRIGIATGLNFLSFIGVPPQGGIEKNLSAADRCPGS